MATKLIPIHKREYNLRNLHREPGEPEYFYNEVLPAYYAPAGMRADDHHVWLTVPEILQKSLHVSGTWDPAYTAVQNGITFITARDITKAEELLQKANEEFLEWRTPKVRKRVILFKIRSNEIAIEYEVLILVDNNCGKYYTVENADGSKRYCGYNLWSISDVETHVGRFIDWSPEAEAWFKKVKELLDKLRHELHTMLMKPHYDEKGKLKGYGYFGPEDIKTFIACDTLPLRFNYQALLESPRPDKTGAD
ncbi:MAG: hypothetical protein ABFC78_02905 [Methanoregula sp.]